MSSVLFHVKKLRSAEEGHTIERVCEGVHSRDVFRRVEVQYSTFLANVPANHNHRWSNDSVLSWKNQSVIFT